MKPYRFTLPKFTGIMVLAVFFSLIADHLFAQPEGFTALNSPDEFATRIETVSQRTETIQADFHQSKQMQYLDVALESSGTFRFKSPDKVLWKYVDPYLYKVIINSGQLSLVSEDSENQFDMNSNEIFRQINELLVVAVTGEIHSTDNYKTDFYENKDFYLAVLAPKSEEVSEMIQQMELFFDKNSMQVKKIRMVESSGDFSLITFKNQVINEPISEDTFQP